MHTDCMLKVGWYLNSQHARDDGAQRSRAPWSPQICVLQERCTCGGKFCTPPRTCENSYNPAMLSDLA